MTTSVREDGDGVAERMGKHANGLVDFHAAGHVDERTVGKKRLVERGKLRRAELGRLGQEVLADEILVLDEGVLQRVDDDAAPRQFGGERRAGVEPAVGEDELRGFLDPDGRVGHDRDGGGQDKAVERQG